MPGVRPATLLFYAFAILSLGSIAWVEGGPRMLASLVGDPDSALRFQSAWGWITMFLTVVFALWAMFAAIGSKSE